MTNRQIHNETNEQMSEQTYVRTNEQTTNSNHHREKYTNEWKLIF